MSWFDNDNYSVLRHLLAVATGSGLDSVTSVRMHWPGRRMATIRALTVFCRKEVRHYEEEQAVDPTPKAVRARGLQGQANSSQES